jgi:hypothetical protein
MEVMQPSFMLLPDFTYLEDGDIQLGTIMTASPETKRPDPRRPLNRRARTPVKDKSIPKQELKQWSWDSSKSLAGKASLSAEITLFSSVCGGLSGGRRDVKALQISCNHVEVKQFAPEKAYMAEALQEDNVQKYAKKLVRPPIYMVTGLMSFAHGANMRTNTANEAEGNVKPVADGTPLNVPVKVGREIRHQQSSPSTLLATPVDPFILAYQLVQLRQKRSGEVEDKDFDKWALFNDESREAPIDYSNAVLDTWGTTPVTPNENWEE